MKKIYLLLFLVLINIAIATETNSTSFTMTYVVDSGIFVNSESTSFNLTSTIGEVTVGNVTSINFWTFLGLQFNNTRTIASDITPPTIEIETLNNSNSTSRPTILLYNVTDTNTISNCKLYLNDSLNITNTSIIKDISQTFTLILANNDYSWRVECTDSFGNLGNTSTNIFNVEYSVPTAPYTGGGGQAIGNYYLQVKVKDDKYNLDQNVEAEVTLMNKNDLPWKAIVTTYLKGPEFDIFKEETYEYNLIPPVCERYFRYDEFEDLCILGDEEMSPNKISFTRRVALPENATKGDWRFYAEVDSTIHPIVKAYDEFDVSMLNLSVYIVAGLFILLVCTFIFKRKKDKKGGK